MYSGVVFNPVPKELAEVLTKTSKPFERFSKLGLDEYAVSCKVNTRKGSERIIRAAFEYEGPVYLRLGRLAVPVLLNEEEYQFEIGKGVVLREGSDVTIFATGQEVYESILAADLLAKDGISAEVINIHTIKPIDEDLIVKSLEKTGKGVTVEEHSIVGGLFSAVSEVAAKKRPTNILAIGVEDVFGHSGPAKELIKEFGLDSEGIYQKVKAFLAD